MTAEKILKIVRREMTAIGRGWRADWSDFDGRTLQTQLDNLDTWAELALANDSESDFTEGIKFLWGHSPNDHPA